jgi:hypothetical protein
VHETGPAERSGHAGCARRPNTALGHTVNSQRQLSANFTPRLTSMEASEMSLRATEQRETHFALLSSVRLVCLLLLLGFFFGDGTRAKKKFFQSNRSAILRPRTLSTYKCSGETKSFFQQTISGTAVWCIPTRSCDEQHQYGSVPVGAPKSHLGTCCTVVFLSHLLPLLLFCAAS